jgi:hypothetical protein
MRFFYFKSKKQIALDGISTLENQLKIKCHVLVVTTGCHHKDFDA